MKKRILIIDDNADLRYSIVEGLKSAGCPFTFLEADSGKKGLNLLKKNKIDLILLDIMMPEMDGWDVAANVHTNPKTKDIPLIFLTGKTDNLSAGMGKYTSQDYITKPFKIADLKNRMEKFLGK